MKPNLFILGFPKCGTTSLAAMLKNVKSVYVPLNKEPHVFNQSLDEANKRLRFYLRNAKPGYLYYLDATPNYIKDIDGFWDHAFKLNIPLGEIKFLICIRDPVKRYISHYVHNYNRGTESRSISDVIDQEIDLYRKGLLKETQYLDYSFYEEKIENLIGRVGAEKVNIVDITELNSPDLLASKIRSFLGLDFEFQLTSEKSNESYIPNSKFINDVLFSDNKVFSLLRKIVPQGYAQAIKSFLVKLNSLPRSDSNEMIFDHESLKNVLKKEIAFYENFKK